MIATVPGYRSGLSVLQQLTYITVPGYCERTLYPRRTLQSSCSKLYFTRYAILQHFTGGSFCATVYCTAVPYDRMRILI